MSAKSEQEEHFGSLIAMQVPRRREPEHLLLKVESFSESKSEKYESDEFLAGGYKWKLVLYPNGDTKRDGSNQISLYISICDTQNLPPGWQVEADFSLFVYNNVSQKYLTFKLADKTRFNWINTEAGFAQLIPLQEFKETSNGYLFGDTCVFGAEVYVTGSSAAKIQTLSSVKKTNINTNKNVFTWKVGNLSVFPGEYRESEKFIIGGVRWYLELYPKGDEDAKDKALSIYLRAVYGELGWYRKIKAEYKLRIKNQLHTNHVERKSTSIFRCSGMGVGWCNFMPLSVLNDESKGFLTNDSLVAEVEITKVEIMQPDHIFSSILRCLWG